jgi:hypothetical protein
LQHSPWRQLGELWRFRQVAAAIALRATVHIQRIALERL